MLRIGSPECVACPFQVACAAHVRTIEKDALHYASRLGNLLRVSRTVEIAKWFNGRWKTDNTAQRASESAQRTLEQWTARGLNPQLLRHKLNPLKRAQDPTLFEAFKFMIEVGPFKPRDVVEHLRDILPDQSKLSFSREVKSTCEALLHANILKKEGRVYTL
jgi:hypothetical protein